MKKATLLDLRRMCNSYNSEEGKTCVYCLLSPHNNESMRSCIDFILTNPYSANNIVIQWCDEHPVETRQDRFLKMFPNAKIAVDGALCICPRFVNKDFSCPTSERRCSDCFKEYWLAEVEE